jgi:hypothetical protein
MGKLIWLLIGLGAGYYVGNMTPAQRANLLTTVKTKVTGITGQEYSIPSTAINTNDNQPQTVYSRGLYQ